MELARYALFTFVDYYPKGGFADLVGIADTVEALDAMLVELKDLDTRHDAWLDDDTGNVPNLSAQEQIRRQAHCNNRYQIADLLERRVIREGDRE